MFIFPCVCVCVTSLVSQPWFLQKETLEMRIRAQVVFVVQGTKVEVESETEGKTVREGRMPTCQLPPCEVPKGTLENCPSQHSTDG